MSAQITRFSHVIWRHLVCTAAIPAVALLLSFVESARADDFTVKILPEETTVLYFNEDNKLLWVEKLGSVKDRSITPVSDEKLLASIPFVKGKYSDGTAVKALKHYDCPTCPEKKADLVTSGIAAKAVYCGRIGGSTVRGEVAPLFVEDLTDIKPRLIELAATSDPSPCPYPKKCHCTQSSCCCW